jgi:hypothetical protein
MCGAKGQEEVDFSMIVPARPWQSSANIPRGSCDQMTTLIDDPDWNPSSSQTPYNAEGSIVRTHDQGTAGARSDRRTVLRGFDQIRNWHCGRHDFYEPPFEFIFPSIPPVTA